MVIGRQFCADYDTKVQHWLTEVRRQEAKINERPFVQRTSVRGIIVKILVLDKSANDELCIVAAQLRENGHNH